MYKQALKQCNASKIAYQHIRVPKIYGIERMDEYLNIKMEYIYSKNYVDYFEDAGFDVNIIGIKRIDSASLRLVILSRH